MTPATIQLYPFSNPAHARIAGWLNVWPDFLHQPTAATLVPLALAFHRAGWEVRERPSGRGLFMEFLYQYN